MPTSPRDLKSFEELEIGIPALHPRSHEHWQRDSWVRFDCACRLRQRREGLWRGVQPEVQGHDSKSSPVPLGAVRRDA